MTDTAAIQALHAGPHRVVLAITGGGSRAISDLLRVPGASNSLLEAVVPYSQAALSDWLEGEPESSCSRETALSMATVAWHRARGLARRSGLTDDDCLGVACTASLASAEPKRGEHRCWIAVERSEGSSIRSLTLVKGARARAGEESLVADLVISTIVAVTGCGELPVRNLLPGEQVVTEDILLPAGIQAVRNGSASLVWSLPGGQLSSTLTLTVPLRGILSGSFNPLHAGHRELRNVAEELLQGSVCFELPIRNADKPPLGAASIESRRAQFDEHALAMSAAPLFVDKAMLFPGVTFVVGYDTAERIIQSRFYRDSESAMRESFNAIRAAGCRFLVAGRQSHGVFETLDQLRVPGGLEDLFEAIPEERFRADVSATALRQSAESSDDVAR